MERYKEASFKELSPHVFAIGGIAYREMINEGRNKCILVSGESGSRNTETTKMLMSYLAYFGGLTAAEGREVEDQVLELSYSDLISQRNYKCMSKTFYSFYMLQKKTFLFLKLS